MNGFHSTDFVLTKLFNHEKLTFMYVLQIPFSLSLFSSLFRNPFNLMNKWTFGICAVHCFVFLPASKPVMALAGVKLANIVGPTWRHSGSYNVVGGGQTVQLAVFNNV